MEPNERIAKLEGQLNSVVRGMERIEKKLDVYSSNFLPRVEADIRFKNIENALEEQKQNKKAAISVAVSILSISVTLVLGIITLLKG